MARPFKTGLSYYPTDTDWEQDIKTQYIINKYKTAALAIIPALWKRIYSDQGYYIEATDYFFKAMASACFVEVEKLREIVDAGLESGLFSREKYETYGILTSKGIQKRYLGIKRATGDKSVIRSEYSLLEDTPEDCPELLKYKSGYCSKNPQESAKSNNNLINEENCPQRKVNKKEKEIKENPPLPPKGEEWEESFGEGISSPVDETIVQTWNTVFPRGTPRHLSGGVMDLNSHYLANISKTLAEYPANTPDGIAVYRRAFITLRDSGYNWQLHSAIKIDNFRLLLTEAENAKKPRSNPGEVSHRAPVHTREDYLTDAQKYQGPKIRNKEVEDE